MMQFSLELGFQYIKNTLHTEYMLKQPLKSENQCIWRQLKIGLSATGVAPLKRVLQSMTSRVFCTYKKPTLQGNRFFKITYCDLSHFFKFMIIREKHIPHVFSCQNHILTYQMGTQGRDFRFLTDSLQSSIGGFALNLYLDGKLPRMKMLGFFFKTIFIIFTFGDSHKR